MDFFDLEIFNLLHFVPQWLELAVELGQFKSVVGNSVQIVVSAYYISKLITISSNKIMTTGNEIFTAVFISEKLGCSKTTIWSSKNSD